jgi:hypothetical protein
MIGPVRKIDFIHRRLWRDDALYRAAVLCGPAPFFGFLIAAGVWAATAASVTPKAPPPEWAAPRGMKPQAASSTQPQKVAPARPLPLNTPDGVPLAYEKGWQVTINPIEISPTLDVDLKPNALKAFPLDGTTIELERILENGPRDQRYVGVGSGFLVVRAEGVYAISARLERPSAEPADCLIRLGFGPGRIVSEHAIGLVKDVIRTFQPAHFELKTGIYRIGWAFGCWHEQRAVGPGRMTVLIEHPGEAGLQPARPDDIVRPERLKH